MLQRWNNQIVLLAYNTPYNTRNFIQQGRVDSGDFSRRSVARAEYKCTSAVFYKMK